MLRISRPRPIFWLLRPTIDRTLLTRPESIVPPRSARRAFTIGSARPALSLNPDPLQRGRDNGNAEAEVPLRTRIYRKRQKLTLYQTRVPGKVLKQMVSVDMLK